MDIYTRLLTGLYMYDSYCFFFLIIRIFNQKHFI
jgi:hypothetical protein